ncbi:MAG: hypothetical protein WDM79_04095 [Terricaulis sp.]
MLSIRDEYVPLIDVGEVFGYRAEAAPPLKSVMLLVEGEDGSRAAFVRGFDPRPAPGRDQEP